MSRDDILKSSKMKSSKIEVGMRPQIGSPTFRSSTSRSISPLPFPQLSLPQHPLIVNTLLYIPFYDMPSKLALPVIDISPYLPSNSSPPDLEGELGSSFPLLPIRPFLLVPDFNSRIFGDIRPWNQ